jgi:glycosidase
MGINTLWLQPVWKTRHGHQGYDVTDYFSLRPDLGTEEELLQLIRAAKGLGMRVILDFVPNHTSLEHPYAQDCIANGRASRYYDFYQRENGGGTFSSALHKDKNGFYYYFWDNLVNLNYNNPRVRRWMAQACVYWLRRLDIDGYRMDALWAMRARAPDFVRELGRALKSVKPDLLLLAEDKKDILMQPMLFDAAYDWTADTSWVSQWSWNFDISRDHYTTIFNFPDEGKRSHLLRKALFGDSVWQSMVLHFIENNDLPRFLTTHSVRQAKAAAALVFLLPGLPMVYNGQEIGARGHPYSPSSIFKADSSIRSMDTLHLFDYYTKLARIRREHPVLQGPDMQEVALSNGGLVCFLRREGEERCLVIVNPGSASSSAVIPSSIFGKATRLWDLLSDDRIGRGRENGFTIHMEGSSVRCLAVE